MLSSLILKNTLKLSYTNSNYNNNSNRNNYKVTKINQNY